MTEVTRAANDSRPSNDSPATANDSLPTGWGGYDTGYWQVFRDAEQYARTELNVPARHVHEAEMKQREQDGPQAG